LQLPLAYTLARTMGWGLSGVLVAIVCSMAVWALIGAIVFKRGKWKERKV
jgi:Na+-driven multidrug efflux pump